MAFDKTNSAHLASLKVKGLTFTQQEQDTTRMILPKFNDPAENIGGTINRPVEELTIVDVAEIIDDAEYDLLTAFNQAWVRTFINRPPDESVQKYKKKFLAIFPATGPGVVGNTRTAALLLLSKPSSWAEDQWGVNTVIGLKDWTAARESS